MAASSPAWTASTMQWRMWSPRMTLPVLSMALSFVAAALLIVNVIWKLVLMKQEKRLIEAGKAVSA